ncbi:MAG: T9SS C-terminal target domain-containing protein [Flavobacteriia bacterium]|nr:T9SS C-terminal target domain-containing protein [Flavobacteriia bacterium]
MKLHFICSVLMQLLVVGAFNAQRVYPLFDDISVDSVLKPQTWASKIAFDPISKHVFYTTAGGTIYEVFENTKTDTLRFSVLDHGIPRVQGLCFVDSTLFLSGNIWYTTIGIGMVVKGILQPNGTRIWSTVLSTSGYPTSSSTGDHGFTGITVDPQKEYLYFSGGSRTSFGEVKTNDGMYPGMREQAITSKIFRIPIDATNIYLHNDSIELQNSGYVFAEGTRNAYSMAFNDQNHLFAIDNAGERDDPEELNWIREGQHYGFPWRIGGNANPLANPNYDASIDPLINPNNGAFLAGHFDADPQFPAAPTGVVFTEPIANHGDAADYYKDENTGQIQKSSESGVPVRTFTAHRSPLGLVIDKNNEIGGNYSGHGFVLSFMPGGDSTGYTPLSPWGSACPFVDPSRELVMLRFSFDSIGQNYSIRTSNIVSGFYLPVDAVQVGHSIYVIENNGGLWKINFPKAQTPPSGFSASNFVYPNPSAAELNCYFPNLNQQKRHLELLSLDGKVIYRSTDFTTEFYKSDISTLSQGGYYIRLIADGEVIARQKIVIN